MENRASGCPVLQDHPGAVTLGFFPGNSALEAVTAMIHLGPAFSPPEAVTAMPHGDAAVYYARENLGVHHVMSAFQESRMQVMEGGGFTKIVSKA